MSAVSAAGLSRGFLFVFAAWLVISLAVPLVDNWEFMRVLLLGPGTILLIVWAAVPVAGALLSLKWLREGHYRAAAAWLVVPATGIVLYVLNAETSDWGRFWLKERAYEQVVADVSVGKCAPQDLDRWRRLAHVDAVDCRQPITIVFVWGGFVSIWNGVVYDASDEIAKPPNQRSPAWKTREIGGLLSCSEVIRALGGHYYRSAGAYSPEGGECG